MKEGTWKTSQKAGLTRTYFPSLLLMILFNIELDSLKCPSVIAHFFNILKYSQQISLNAKQVTFTICLMRSSRQRQTKEKKKTAKWHIGSSLKTRRDVWQWAAKVVKWGHLHLSSTSLTTEPHCPPQASRPSILLSRRVGLFIFLKSSSIWAA